MPTRLVALDQEGPDIPLQDRAMIVVGRHPQCDVRLDSLRVSRHHCCMIPDQGEVIVRDLGSTNGIRINGHRVDLGRLRADDELSIAHIRYRLVNGQSQEATMADPAGLRSFPSRSLEREVEADAIDPNISPPGNIGAMFAARGVENPLAAAVRNMLPAGVADRCQIQVIVKMDQDAEPGVDVAPAPALGAAGVSASGAD